MMSTKKSSDLWLGLILVVILVGAIYLLRFLFQAELPSAVLESPRAKGPVNAPIQIIQYSDFECPSCKLAQPTLDKVMNEKPGSIRLVYMHFPLESHRWSFFAHRAAECAAQQNRFWPYHDRLYAEQEIWPRSLETPVEPLLRYAQDSQVPDLNQFAACLADTNMDKKINAEKDTGVGLGVRSTPSFFVNGKIVVGAQAVEEEVKKINAGKQGS